jgi:hypothetical protein
MSASSIDTANEPTSSQLIYDWFPHIFDTILESCDDKTLLAMRLTGKDLRHEVDHKILGKHLEFLLGDLHKEEGSKMGTRYGKVALTKGRRHPRLWGWSPEANADKKEQARGRFLVTSALGARAIPGEPSEPRFEPFPFVATTLAVDDTAPEQGRGPADISMDPGRKALAYADTLLFQAPA